jgi:hypothetical protein
LLASAALVQSVQNNWGTYTSSRLVHQGSFHSAAALQGQVQQDWVRQNAALEKWDANHWSHAKSRFPTEARFALAIVLTRPESRRLPNRPGTSATFMTQGLGANLEFDKPWVLEPETIGMVQQTLLELSALVDVPEVGAEARLRRAVLQFHRRNLARACQIYAWRPRHDIRSSPISRTSTLV